MGVKPFYYHTSGSLFATSTEICPIFELPFEPTLNETKVGDFLLGRFGNKSNTYMKKSSDCHLHTV